jgi:biopolymer transport protein ExbB
MIPILACSVIALAIIIEKMLFWMRQTGAAPERLLAVAQTGRLDEMVHEAQKANHPVARVLAAGADDRNPSPTLAMEAAAMEEMARMKRYLPALDTIITLSPLLGLLGTIIGMIQSFGILSTTGMGQPHAVTGGVAEALIATAAGLIVASMTLIPYNFFLAKAEKTTEEMERYATRLEMILEGSRSPSSAGNVVEMRPR